MISRPEIQLRAAEYGNPTWGYRRGEGGEIEKDLFDGDPPPGWFDSPAKIDGAPDDDAKGTENTEDQGEDAEPVDETVLPPYANHNYQVLISELQRRTGKAPAFGTSKTTLIKMLEKSEAT